MSNDQTERSACLSCACGFELPLLDNSPQATVGTLFVKGAPSRSLTYLIRIRNRKVHTSIRMERQPLQKRGMTYHLDLNENSRTSTRRKLEHNRQHNEGMNSRSSMRTASLDYRPPQASQQQSSGTEAPHTVIVQGPSKRDRDDSNSSHFGRNTQRRNSQPVTYSRLNLTDTHEQVSRCTNNRDAQAAMFRLLL